VAFVNFSEKKYFSRQSAIFVPARDFALNAINSTGYLAPDQRSANDKKQISAMKTRLHQFQAHRGKEVK
jgi:hypothetical protein